MPTLKLNAYKQYSAMFLFLLLFTSGPSLLNASTKTFTASKVTIGDGTHTVTTTTCDLSNVCSSASNFTISADIVQPVSWSATRSDVPNDGDKFYLNHMSILISTDLKVGYNSGTVNLPVGTYTIDALAGYMGDGTYSITYTEKGTAPPKQGVVYCPGDLFLGTADPSRHESIVRIRSFENTGPVPLTFGSITVVSDTPGIFSDAIPPSLAPVAPLKLRDVSIKFAPQAQLRYSGSLNITDASNKTIGTCTFNALGHTDPIICFPCIVHGPHSGLMTGIFLIVFVALVGWWAIKRLLRHPQNNSR